MTIRPTVVSVLSPRVKREDSVDSEDDSAGVFAAG